MKKQSNENNNQRRKKSDPQERQLFSNASDVNYDDIPKEVYGILAKILIRAANEQHNDKAQKKNELW